MLHPGIDKRNGEGNLECTRKERTQEKCQPLQVMSGKSHLRIQEAAVSRNMGTDKIDIGFS